MEIRIRSNGQTMYEAEFRAYQLNNGGPSWGVTTQEILNSLEADVVLEGPYPSATEYQVISRDGTQLIDNNWYTKYKVTDMDQEGIDAVNARKVEQNKDKAARLLAESDFYDLPNTSVKIENIADILAYRDALRAIALNPTFDAIFPVKPDTIWA